MLTKVLSYVGECCRDDGKIKTSKQKGQHEAQNDLQSVDTAVMLLLLAWFASSAVLTAFVYCSKGRMHDFWATAMAEIIKLV